MEYHRPARGVPPGESRAWMGTKEAVAGIAPESWLECGLGTEVDPTPSPPEASMLAAHDAVTTDSPKVQYTFGTLVNRGRHAACTKCLSQLLEAARPPVPDDPLGERETRAFAMARHRSLHWPGSNTPSCFPVFLDPRPLNPGPLP